jgi:hypothetical protein
MSRGRHLEFGSTVSGATAGAGGAGFPRPGSGGIQEPDMHVQPGPGADVAHPIDDGLPAACDGAAVAEASVVLAARVALAVLDAAALVV